MSAQSQTKRLIAAAAITGAVLGTAGIAGAATGRFASNRPSQPAVVVKPFAAVQAGALAGQSRVKAAPVAATTAALDPATGVTAAVPAAAPTTTTTAAVAVTTTSTTVPEADEVNEANEHPRATTTTLAGTVTTASTTVESDDDNEGDDEGDDAAEEAAEAAAKAARAAAKAAAAATAAASGQPVTTLKPPKQGDESEGKDHGRGDGGGDND